MIALAGWRKYWAVRAELRELRTKYESMADHYRAALLRVDAAEERERDLAFQLECMSCDNADLERVNAALRDGLRFFDPTEGAK